MKCCKTCKWIEVPPDKGGRKVVRKTRVYSCAFPQPPMILPASITNHPNWRDQFPRYRMVGSDGSDCPTWELKEAAK